jgi:uncharacterized protein YdeI (YjbR/CyaY-like superfamily)
MNVTHFPSAADFRRWLAAHHATAAELHVGFYKKASGKGGLSYAEAVDEALCFGWIDGIIRKIDEHSYTHRFTPRRPGSIWSLVNVRHVARLTTAGKMHAAGIAAFAARDQKQTGIYSFEQRPQSFPPALEKKFRAHAQAWAFFSAQPPGYRRLAIYKVISPKQEATRERWLARVIAESAAGRRVAELTGISKRTP